MLAFAVDRHEEFRLGQRMHHLDLLAAGVTRNVNLFLFVVDVHTAAVHFVYDLADENLVSGNRVRTEHDEIARGELDLIVIGKRHTVERRHRLALRPRRDYRDLLGLVAPDVGYVDQHVLRHVHVAEAHRRADDVYHAPPRDGDVPAVFG